MYGYFKCDQFFEGKILHTPKQSFTNGRENGDLELPLFDFTTINYATDNFSIKNVLGQGGFGPLFKVFS